MTWTAPSVERTQQLGGLGAVTELQMSEGWLNWHQETLLAKCAGLEPVPLARTTVEPSDLTLLGLVRHMAEVERWWFRRRTVVEFYLHLAAALVTLRMLIRHATIHYRWDQRPTTRRLK